MARTRVRHSTQLLRDFAQPITIPEDAGFDEAIPKSPIIQPNSITLTTTGNIDDLDFGNANLIRMNNASLSTIRGLKAGADGQQVTIISVGAGQVDFANQNTGSVAGNRLINSVTSYVTSLAAGVGSATYQYDATTARWRLVSHNQGEFIDIAYSSSNFQARGSMTWTVDAGDQATYAYYIEGRKVSIIFSINTSTVGGTLDNQLWIITPFTSSRETQHLGRYAENVAAVLTSSVINNSISASDTKIILHRLDFSNFTAQTNTAYAFGNTIMAVT